MPKPDKVSIILENDFNTIGSQAIFNGIIFKLQSVESAYPSPGANPDIVVMILKDIKYG
jgi:hypothetical protein